MNTPAEARRIEQRSLRFGVGANAVMALAGFSAHVLTGSSALLLDGLYSAVLVGSSLIASRITAMWCGRRIEPGPMAKKARNLCICCFALWCCLG